MNNFDRSRRRAASERSPLKFFGPPTPGASEGTGVSPGSTGNSKSILIRKCVSSSDVSYDSFLRRNNRTKKSDEDCSLWLLSIKQLSLSKALARKQPKQQHIGNANIPPGVSYRVPCIVIFFVVSITLYYYVYHHHNTGQNDSAKVGDNNHEDLVWMWDHNFYHPPTPPVNIQHKNNGKGNNWTTLLLESEVKKSDLLIAQSFGCQKCEDRIFADISSRPNRAYARHWGRDFVLFPVATRTTTGPSASQRQLASVSDFAPVLERVLDMQTAGKGEGEVSMQSGYDVAVMLQPDVMIIDMEYDIRNLLRSEKLLSVATFSTTGTGDLSSLPSISEQGSAVFVNLRHPKVLEVTQNWVDAVRQLSSSSGLSVEERPETQQAPLSLLLDAVNAIAPNIEADNKHHRHEAKEDFNAPLSSLSLASSSLIQWLHITSQGFIVNNRDGQQALKVPPLLYEGDSEALIPTLHASADSVCYRYFPKCEVL